MEETNKPPNLSDLRDELGPEYTVQRTPRGRYRIFPPALSGEAVVDEATLEDALFQALGRKHHVSPYWLKLLDDCFRNNRNKDLYHVG